MKAFFMYRRFSQKLVLEGFKTSNIGLSSSHVLIKGRELSLFQHVLNKKCYLENAEFLQHF